MATREERRTTRKEWLARKEAEDARTARVLAKQKQLEEVRFEETDGEGETVVVPGSSDRGYENSTANVHLVVPGGDMLHDFTGEALGIEALEKVPGFEKLYRVRCGRCGRSALFTKTALEITRELPPGRRCPAKGERGWT